MFWNKILSCALFAISLKLLLERKKQTFFVNLLDFTLLLFVAFLFVLIHKN